MILIATYLTSIAQGATFHVSPFGSNAPPYSSYATAAVDPRSAIDLASGFGDTVLIHAGQYDVDTTIDLPRGLTLRGVGADSASLVSRNFFQSEELLMLGGDNEIAWLTVEHGHLAGAPSVQGFFMHGTPGDVAIHHCRILRLETFGTPVGTLSFHDNFCEISQSPGIVTTGGMHCRIFRNRFELGRFAGGGQCIIALGSDIKAYDNVFDLRGLYNDHEYVAFEVNMSSLSTLTVRNNLILGALVAFAWRYHAGVIENNTIIDAIYPLELYHDARPVPRSVVIRNNAFIECQEVPYLSSCNDCDPGASLTFVHNGFWPPVDTLWVHGQHLEKLTITDSANFVGYPMFTSDSTYRLQYGSPLIDQGDPAVIDVDGSRSDVGWTGGPGGVTYDYMDEPPGRPDSLEAMGEGRSVSVQWSPRPETDLSAYRLFRGTESGFWTPGAVPLHIITPPDTMFTDILPESTCSAYYVVTAVDNSGQESTPSNETLYIVPDCPPDTDTVYVSRPRISLVYPNPVTTSATVDIEMPVEASATTPVEVAVYDVAGRHVGIVFSGHLAAGKTQVVWTPTTREGSRLAAGVYLMHLTVDGRAQDFVAKVAVLR